MTLLMHLQVLGPGSLMENVGMLPVDWGERLEASLYLGLLFMNDGNAEC